MSYLSIFLTGIDNQLKSSRNWRCEMQLTFLLNFGNSFLINNGYDIKS